MGKIGLIIQREFYTRVRKRSFIIMTIMGPVLMALLLVMPVLLSDYTDSIKIINVIDDTGVIKHSLKNNDNILFVYEKTNIEIARKEAEKKGFYGVIHVPAFRDNDIRNLQNNIKFYSVSQVSPGVKNYVRTQLERQIERLQLQSQNVDQDLVESVKLNSNVPLPVIPIDPSKSNVNIELNVALGWIGGILEYLFIFMFGAQAMRGVIEEKTNRIVEVVISSVKPIQLMFGKIIGISLVGFTQFMLWIILTGSVYGIFMATVVKDKFSSEKIESIMRQNPDGTGMDIDQLQQTGRIIETVNQINWWVMIFVFLIYFIFGYLLYGSMFAAIGSAVDSESDTQQFTLPVTLPLIFSFLMVQVVINDPSGDLARLLSFIPLTSPIIMMVRIPFGVPIWEVAISLALLIFGFILSTWIAAKIYRTGILMYGKKVSWKEVWRWIRY